MGRFSGNSTSNDQPKNTTNEAAQTGADSSIDQQTTTQTTEEKFEAAVGSAQGLPIEEDMIFNPDTNDLAAQMLQDPQMAMTGMQSSLHIPQADQQALAVLQSLSKPYEHGDNQASDGFERMPGYYTVHAGKVGKLMGKSIAGSFYYAFDDLDAKGSAYLDKLVELQRATKVEAIGNDTE